MKNSYPYEKLSNAVTSMAVSPKSIQDRIASAYVYNLIHVKADEIPEEARFKFNDIQERLTAVKAKSNEGNVNASIAEMSDEEAVSIAHDILYVYDIIKAEYYA